MILCGRLPSRDRHAEMITSRTGSSNSAPPRKTTEGLESAVRAIPLHDEHMLATESRTFRMLTGRVGEAARAIALQLAVTLADGALAAELIEGARLQVEPGEADPDDTDLAGRRSRVR